ncbi:hypothetical protein [Streptomyces yaizuensis]|uniref:Uncharacterized protein n=1 Tax=Streptomyces yaizuensis TaxID=2989713 RepID=A0ABQ5NXZ7_9ACTN|nr:hypothetical protein [Streptomyces sp. YSPA8]GLF95239.1 hypothetical protein SYYSPA8_13100 [Streptomyces sp. YSPA8]
MDSPASWPTRSPYKLDWDEGPQSIAALKEALSPWPEVLERFVHDLESAPFTGDEPLENVRSVISEYRREWMLLVHPLIRQAVEESASGPSGDGVPADVVFAEYDPTTFEHASGDRR